MITVVIVDFRRVRLLMMIGTGVSVGPVTACTVKPTGHAHQHGAVPFKRKHDATILLPTGMVFPMSVFLSTGCVWDPMMPLVPQAPPPLWATAAPTMAMPQGVPARPCCVSTITAPKNAPAKPQVPSPLGSIVAPTMVKRCLAS